MESWEQWENEDGKEDIQQKQQAKDDDEERILREIAEKEKQKKIKEKQEEEEKNKIREQQKNVVTNKKKKNQDLEMKFQEKQPHMNQAFNMPESKKLESQYEEKMRKQKQVEEADCKNIVDMFSGLMEKEQKELKDETEFLNLAQNCAEILKKTNKKNTKFIITFLNSLMDNLYPALTSKDYDLVNQKCKVLFNTKQRDEKPKKKQTNKPSVNLGATKSINYDVDSSEEEEEQQAGNARDVEDFM